MARSFRLTKRHLLILAQLAGHPGCSYLELVNDKAYLTIGHGSDGWEYVGSKAAEDLLEQEMIQPGSDATSYQVTPAGYEAAVAACKPILRRFIEASTNGGDHDWNFYYNNKADGTILVRMGWYALHMLKGRELELTSRGRAVAEGAEIPIPKFDEGRYAREQARLRRQTDIAVAKNQLTEAERLVVEKACAAFKQECSFDDLEAAVNALEKLRTELNILQAQEAA